MLRPLDDNMRAQLEGAFTNTQTFASSDGAAYTAFFGQRSGITADRAMRVAAVFACVRLIAGAIASLPLNVYQRTSEGGRERPQNEHPYWWLLNEQPSPIWTSALAWENTVTSMLLWGDGYFWIRRNRLTNEVVELRPMSYHSTIVERVDNRLRYFFDDFGNRFGADQSDVLHLPGFGFNGLHGMSVISYAASNAASGAASADDHSAKFFESGTMAKHALTVPGSMDPKAVANTRDEWQNQYAGNKNAYRPIILQNGATLQELSMSAVDSQLLESRQYQVEDIARAFGIAPVLIGASTTSNFGTGVKEHSRGLTAYTLNRYLGPIAQECNRKLWPTREKYFVEHDTEAYLQADPAERATIARNALGGAQGAGYKTVNEVRRELKLPPVPGGDVLYTPPTATQQTQGNQNAQDAQSAA